MKKTAIILLVLISVAVLGQGLNGRRINKRNRFQETYMIDQGFEYVTRLNEWRQCRDIVDSNGNISCIEVIGERDSNEILSELELIAPTSQIQIRKSDEEKYLAIGKSNTRDSLNMGDINWTTRIFTDEKLNKFKQYSEFTKLIVQPTKSAIEITDTLVLEADVQGVPGVPADGAINTAFWLDTVEGVDNVRIVAQLTDENGPVIYENVSEIAWENGAGFSLDPGEDFITLAPGFDTEYPLLEYVTFYFPEEVQVRGVTSGSAFTPWYAADGYFYQAEEVFALKNWRDDVDYAVDDYIIEDGIIYQTVFAGYQTGNFASNAGKWCSVRGYARTGEMYFDANTTETAIGIKDTWYEIDNATAGVLAGFSFSDGDLTANAGTEGSFIISYNMSLNTEAANVVFDFATSINDVIINKSISETKFESRDIESVPGQAVVVAVDEGDVIKLETRNLTNTTNVTVKYGNLMIVQACDRKIGG